MAKLKDMVSIDGKTEMNTKEIGFRGWKMAEGYLRLLQVIAMRGTGKVENQMAGVSMSLPREMSMRANGWIDKSMAKVWKNTQKMDVAIKDFFQTTYQMALDAIPTKIRQHIQAISSMVRKLAYASSL